VSPSSRNGNANDGNRWLLLLILGYVLMSCHAGDIKEAVMVPGEEIIATNANGTMAIRAKTERKRQYQWNDQDKTIELMPRRERWNGMLGLYNPGSEIFPMTLLNRTRIVAQEAELHFESESEALEWLRSQRPMKWVYTSKGLVFGWFETPTRNQVNVDVYQIYINKKNPVNLPGANDNAIHIQMPR
jgi:hypothetical protein